MPIPMIEPEWNDAPTVYDLVVRGARLPVVDMVHVENSFAARLAHRWTSMRTTTRAMAIVDVAFSPATGDMRGIEPSVTRVVAEISEDYDLVLHLMLWNGRRIAIVRHTNDDAEEFATPRPYSLGVLNVEGTEWGWTDLLTKGDLFARTRTDHPSMIELGTYDAAELASSGRTRT